MSTVTAKPAQNGHWQNYVEYNKLLRTWFVSFGIGALVLLLANPTLLETLRTAHDAYFVVGCFLAGCGFQIAIALVNKTIAWHLSCGEQYPKFKNNWRYKRCEWLSEHYWIDLLLDVLSLVAFAVAVVLLTGAILSDAPIIVSPPMPR